MIYQSHAGSIHYRVEGPPDAAAVAFTHGAGLDSHMFDAQVAALRDRYQILVWDMPGHGNSARLQGPLPFEGMLNAGTLGVEAVPHQPLLIVHGEVEWPDSVAQRCHAWHAATPGSTYAVIPGAGHNANQDSPATFNRVLLQFLNSLDPGRAAHGADAPGRPDRPNVVAPKLS